MFATTSIRAVMRDAFTRYRRYHSMNPPGHTNSSRIWQQAATNGNQGSQSIMHLHYEE